MVPTFNASMKHYCKIHNASYIPLSNYIDYQNLACWKKNDRIHLSGDVGLPGITAAIKDFVYKSRQQIKHENLFGAHPEWIRKIPLYGKCRLVSMNALHFY